MKTSIKTALTAIALSAIVAGPAAAMSGQSINGAVQSAITEGNVSVSVENGVATLFGWVDSNVAENAALQVALSFDNVDRVVDLITISH